MRKKHLFTEAMNSLNTKWIHCDHTFKAARVISKSVEEELKNIECVTLERDVCHTSPQVVGQHETNSLSEN